MSRLYSCPYSTSTTCTHEIPCMGCETFYEVTPLKIEVSDEPKPLVQVLCKHIYGFINFNVCNDECSESIVITKHGQKVDPYIKDKNYEGYGRNILRCDFCPKCGVEL
jgi:hypothetical protein